MEDDQQRFDTWSAYADVSRKWAQTMDAKAGFVTAVSLGLIAALWSGVKLAETTSCTLKWVGGATTTLAVGAILCALMAVLPRDRLSKIFQHHDWTPTYNPISFYGYVSKTYGPEDFPSFQRVAAELDIKEQAAEALEQHFTISHVTAAKAAWVERAGYCLLLAVLGAGIAFIVRLFV